MFRVLTAAKVVIYILVYYRVFKHTPLSFELIILALALLVSGFWRSYYNYDRLKINTFTLNLDLLLAFLFSLIVHNGSFDKLFIMFMLEGIAVLPRPQWIIYLAFNLAVNGSALALYDWRTDGLVQAPEAAQVLLYCLFFLLVWSERRQREQSRAYKKLSQELLYTNMQLKESIAWSDKLASQAERRRIAAEMHDSLGHDLTALILTLEAGRKLMQRDREASMGYWDKSLELARGAITSVRELVSSTKESNSGFELIASLHKMASVMEELNLLRIELDIEADDIELSEIEQFNIYRVFQEAVTNTMKHANADRAGISILGEGSRLRFNYWDNGSGVAEIRAGNGLEGIAARVAEIHGAISFESSIGGGFRMHGLIEKPGGNS
ncbi:MAG: histidine kinase [Syntrophomonadaceae bacterium]